jgi:hypothetical protein
MSTLCTVAHRILNGCELSLLPVGLQMAFQENVKFVQQEERQSQLSNIITHNAELQQNIRNGLRDTYLLTYVRS